MTPVELAHEQALQDQSLATWLARVGPGDRDGQAPTLELLRAEGPVASTTAGPRTAVFDGILHNRADLRRILGERPDADDATLVLKGYQRWGAEVLQELKGIFALAIWDADAEDLVLARDPLGIYPLFYADAGSELLFSTSIDALLESGRVPGSLNRAALADHLCHRWPDREETFFEAIKRVPACHALLGKRGTRRLHRYWDPAPPGDEMDWVGEDELEQFHELFDQAVSRCLSLGPTGIFLSGGLDSVSVAAAAIDNCRTQGLPEPLAFSVVFPQPDCNEELVQRGAARGLGLSHFLLNLDDAVKPKGLLLSTCEAQIGRTAPAINYYTPPYLQLAREASARGCKTVITGNGGDEWLTVTPFYAADLIRSLDLRRLGRHAGSIRRSYNLSTPRVWHNALWRFGTKPLLSSAAGAFLRTAAPGVSEWRRRRVLRGDVPDWVAPGRALADQIEHRGVEHWPAPPSDGWYRHELREGLDHRLVSMEMEENFENARRTGTRTLSPFLDADLVHFLYRVPPDLLLDRGGRTKGLVRENLARRLPDLGFERQKKITAVPFAREVAIEQGARAWKELGGVAALAELDIVEPKRFERQLEKIVSGRAEDAYFRIWDVLNLESWTRSRI